MTVQPQETILIVDFGSQVTQLIARRVREDGVYCEIVPFNKAESAFNAMKPKGELVLDAGAANALRAGKSLLPAGVTKVTGSFGRGEPVAILSPEGAVLGKGLVRYTSAEARKIAGHRSSEIEAILGYQGRAALLHRDDMVV